MGQVSYQYHKRLKFQRTWREFFRDLWAAAKDAAHRWYVTEFADWMDRR